MRLHDRYLFRELLTPLAFCFGGFLIFWVSVFFLTQVETIHEKKLSIPEAFAYCFASLPGNLVFLLPILLLLSLLYALTQHARHNEITALRATGVGLWRVCAPYFAVGLVATAFYFSLNEFIVPVCDRWADEILNRHVKSQSESNEKSKLTQHSFRNSRANRSWMFYGDYDAVNNSMRNPTVTWTLPDLSWRAVRADQAV